MNRFIHRNWGEGFVNIFLDLIKNISRRSSLIFACAPVHLRKCCRCDIACAWFSLPLADAPASPCAVYRPTSVELTDLLRTPRLCLVPELGREPIAAESAQPKLVRQRHPQEGNPSPVFFDPLHLHQIT